ncbi:hypothetical protein BJ742DRAFT_287434 [Cladochytrium replicatum]|nr:hypothetical protein BJ742DRAFT_287434 [Cladochytrium replicatum]
MPAIRHSLSHASKMDGIEKCRDRSQYRRQDSKMKPIECSTSELGPLSTKPRPSHPRKMAPIPRSRYYEPLPSPPISDTSSEDLCLPDAVEPLSPSREEDEPQKMMELQCINQYSRKRRRSSIINFFDDSRFNKRARADGRHIMRLHSSDRHQITLLELPNEILQSILSHAAAMNPKFAMEASRANRAMHTLVTSLSYWRDSFLTSTLDPPSVTQPTSWLQAFAKAFPTNSCHRCNSIHPTPSLLKARPLPTSPSGSTAPPPELRMCASCFHSEWNRFRSLAAHPDDHVDASTGKKKRRICELFAQGWVKKSALELLQTSEEKCTDCHCSVKWFAYSEFSLMVRFGECATYRVN